MRNGPFEAVRRQAVHYRRLAAERRTWDRFAGAYLADKRKRDDEDEARIDELARRHVEGHGGIDADPPDAVRNSSNLSVSSRQEQPS